MKNLICCIFAVLLTAAFITGCKKDKSLEHTQVSEVTNLFSPDNNKYIKLDPLTGTAVFEWAQARAEDGGLVMYEVAFDKENGDFSKPLYSVSSDGTGQYNRLTISYKILNRVAELAGIEPSSVGKIKWQVWSSKGVNVKKSLESRILELERPAGLPAPSDLFLTGDASEGGTEVGKAVRFKQIENGVFETYTSLKAGTYHFIDRITGTPASYTISAKGLLAEGNNDITVTGAAKIYRIVIDFGALSVKTTEIVSVGLWFAPDNKIWFELPYKGGGQWQVKDASVVFKQETWGRDERYKFRLTVKDNAGKQSTEDWGSKNSDNSRPDGNSPLSYWYVYAQPTSQWDYCFKFNANADKKNVDVLVDFSAAAAAYTHSITIK